MHSTVIAVLLALGGISAAAAFNNDPMCGQKSASHPDNIIIKDGKIQGAAHGIIGGGEAVAHSWPWQASIAAYKKGSCGGTIINKNWILTAAHCIDNVEASNVAVGLGLHSSDYISLLTGQAGDAGSTTCGVVEIIEHEEYDKVKKRKLDYDIALLKLDCDLQWSDTIRPACLPASSDSFYTKGEKVVLTGWGKVASYEQETDKLKQLVTSVVGRQEPDFLPGGKVATAGDQFGTCSGDSGGPMNALRGGKWYVAGVLSSGSAGSDNKYCESVDGTSNYTHVPGFVEWISSHVQ